MAECPHAFLMVVEPMSWCDSDVVFSAIKLDKNGEAMEARTLDQCYRAVGGTVDDENCNADVIRRG